MEKKITIQLTDESARRLEIFLQGFMPTHKFQAPYAGLEIKAFDELYKQLREALDFADVASKSEPK